MPLRENAPDESVHLLRLFRLRCAFCADRPDRLVGYADTVEVRGCQPAKTALQLPAHDPVRLAPVALLERLAHAHNRGQAGANRGLSFLADEEVGVAIKLAPLGVADDDVGRA